MCTCVFRWNQLDIAIVALSIMGITLEELKMSAALPINPTIIRIMRVLRIARGRSTHAFIYQNIQGVIIVYIITDTSVVYNADHFSCMYSCIVL